MSTVTKEPTVIVKPSQPTPLSVGVVRLAPVDQVMPRFYAIFIRLFADSADLLTRERLTSSLSETLIHFPILAGSLVDLGRGEYGVDCNDSGAQITFATSSENLEAMKASNGRPQPPQHPQGIAEMVFVPSSTAHAILHARVTYLADKGVALGISIHHCVTDGAGMSLFIKAWSNSFQGLAIPEISHNRSLLAASTQKLSPDFHPIEYNYVAPAPPGSAPAAAAPPATAPPPARQVVFHFTGENLKALKRDASEGNGSGGQWISTHDALTALMWRGIVRARRTKDTNVKLGFAINGRDRFVPPLPKGYFGNVNFYGCLNLPAEEVLAAPLGRIAQLSREAIDRMNDSRMRSCLDWIQAQENVAHIQPSFFKPGVDFALTSWAKFGAYDDDFGTGGKLLYAGNIGINFSGLMIFLESPRKDDGVSVALGLLEEHMQKFETDPEICKYLF